MYIFALWKVTKEFCYQDLTKWEGQKVQLDGIIGNGRFIVKRKRGNQDGYLVFAPYNIQKTKASEVAWSKKAERRMIVNLGWVPKSSKHLIVDSCEVVALPANDYNENLMEAFETSEVNNDGLERNSSESEFWYPVSTITAYVRRGEQRDILRGYNSWQSSKLFKFIDLPLMTKLFGAVNSNEASTIYLDRILPEYFLNYF